MNFLQVVSLVTEIDALIKQLEADGTLAKIEAVVAAFESESKSGVVTQLIGKLKTLKL